MASFGEVVGTVPVQFWRKVWQRLKVRYLRASSESTFIFLIAVIFLTLSVAVFHTSLETRRAHENALRKDLMAAIGEELEPRDDVQRPGAIAPLMAAVTRLGTRDIACAGDGSLACKKAALLSEAVGALFELARNESTALQQKSAVQAPKAGETDKEAETSREKLREPRLQALWARAGRGTGWEVWRDSAHKAVERASRALNRQPDDVPMGECERSGDGGAALATGRSRCSQFRGPGFPQSMVPAYAYERVFSKSVPADTKDAQTDTRTADSSVSVDAKDARADTKTVDNGAGSRVVDGNGGDSRSNKDDVGDIAGAIRRSLVVAELLDPATSLVSGMEPIGSPASDDSRELVQAYVISKESVLRIWAKGQGGAADHLKPQRFWAQAPYFHKAWDDGEKIWTSHPYLDVGGFGIVETQCAPLTAKSDEKLVYLGIVCTDLALTSRVLDSVFDELSRSLSIDIGRIDLSGYRNDAPKFYRNRVVSTDPELAEIADWVGDQLRQPNFPVPESKYRRGINVLEYGDEFIFVVPVRSGPNGMPDIWFFRLSASEVPLVVSVLDWVSFFLVIGTLWFGYSGYRGAREAGAAAKEIALFRSLQVGVIVTDSNDRIICGNDRAEEILGCSLPKSLDARNHGPRFLHDIVQRIVVKDSSDKEISAGSGADAQQLKDYAETIKYRKISTRKVEETRNQGGVSHYFAEVSVNNTHNWIAVRAGPILSIQRKVFGRDMKENLRFGTIDPVSSLTRMRIELELKEIRKKRMAVKKRKESAP